MSAITRTLLVANPSLDVYGSDLQMVETVAALREQDWHVVVAAPTDGPLAARLRSLGADVRLQPFPVLRRADATVAGIVRLALSSVKALPGMARLIRTTQPDVVLVNTITLPLWPVVARLTRRTTVCHVHEAEDKDNRTVRRLMGLFVAMADVVVVNSRTTLESICSVTPRLRARTRLVYNGVEPPATDPLPPGVDGRPRLVVVGRLSPRKAPDVALEAAALVRKGGHDVEVELVGTPASGQEWFRDELERRSEEPDLAGAVTFAGYVAPVWPALARSNIVVAPSLGESFGNAVVEGQLALRPVVATGVQGHRETVAHDETGILVPPQDPSALADAVKRLLDEPDLAARLAERGRAVALERFTSERYREDMRSLMNELAHQPEGRH